MKRRAVLALLATVATRPALLRAQSAGDVRRVGLLATAAAEALSPLLDSFCLGLQERGWKVGVNVLVDYEIEDGSFDRLEQRAITLVHRNVDVIVTVDTPATEAARRATREIPIVIAAAADPVDAGLVESLAHPGGNITGLSLLAPETDQKNVEFVKELLPAATRIAMIWDPGNRGMSLRLRAIQEAAEKIGLGLQLIAASEVDQLRNGLVAAANDRPNALLVLSPIYEAYRNEIVDFTNRTHVPLMFDTARLVSEPGALQSYGADLSALFFRSAAYVDKILKGAEPADLPVEQPTKFELALNLKTAKAMHIMVSPELLARADKVIE